MEKPLRRRIFVFQVKDRQRIRQYSGLYVGSSRRGNCTRAEDIFVVTAAEDCKISEWKKGQHLLISDSFELEPIDLDLWDKYREDPAFAKLRSYVDAVEGKVCTTIVHEDSVLGEVEGDVFQEDTQW